MGRLGRSDRGRSAVLTFGNKEVLGLYIYIGYDVLVKAVIRSLRTERREKPNGSARVYRGADPVQHCIPGPGHPFFTLDSQG